MPEPSPASQGRNWALGALVFFGGFAVMVLEIVGARDMQPIFGGDLYVWASQIGVVMMAENAWTIASARPDLRAKNMQTSIKWLLVVWETDKLKKKDYAAHAMVPINKMWTSIDLNLQLLPQHSALTLRLCPTKTPGRKQCCSLLKTCEDGEANEHK